MNDKPHFIVISRGRGPSNYPVKHDNANKAVQEAARLARANRGETFTVYKSYCEAVSNDVTFRSLSPEYSFDDEIPF